MTWSSQQPTTPPVCPTLGPNPAALRLDPAGGPITGGTWRPSVDHDPPLGFQPGYDADFVFLLPGLNPPVCDPPRGIRFVPFSHPIGFLRGAPIEIRIPDDLALVGQTFVCQVISYDRRLAPPDRFLWTNGLEVLVGPGGGN